MVKLYGLSPTIILNFVLNFIKQFSKAIRIFIYRKEDTIIKLLRDIVKLFIHTLIVD